MIQKCIFYLSFLLLLIAFSTGIKTSAADMMRVTINGPSMCGVVVSTMKQSAAHVRLSNTHWVEVSGFRIVLGYMKKAQRDVAAPLLGFYYSFFIFLATIASIHAMAVMLTISRTELSMSVKWIGLFSPIWIGPITSVSLMFWIS